VGEDEESNWIQACLAGDHDAYERLIGRYQQMVHGLTYRMTGDAAESEDLAQEVFIAAWRQLASFRGCSSFSSWLYRIAANRCLNWRRGIARRKAVHEQWRARAAEADSGCEADRDWIQDALLRLDPKLRAAIVLTFYEGMSHAQAAEVLDCSEATVSWRVFKARKQLRRLLSPMKTMGCARDE